ncbi:MAG: alpha/beta hydrolase [Myxococcales bacterium]|nr:alpha/beta hydrolase [Myxococcales bacterium]
MVSESLYAFAERRRFMISGRSLELAFASFEASGSGARARRIVLVHGNGLHLDHWRPFLPRLRRLGRVVALDLPGFGRSEVHREGPLTLDDHADALLGVLRHLDGIHGPEPEVLIGHSHGGAIAQTLAARHPSRIAALVLLASIGTPAHEAIRLASMPILGGLLLRAAGATMHPRLAALRRPLTRSLARAAFDPEPVPEGFVEALLALSERRPEVLRTAVRASQGDPCRLLRVRASRIEAPVFFAHARGDRLIPLDRARNLEGQLRALGREVEFLELAGGHMVHQTHPERVFPPLEAWLEAIAPGH